MGAIGDLCKAVKELLDGGLGKAETALSEGLCGLSEIELSASVPVVHVEGGLHADDKLVEDAVLKESDLSASVGVKDADQHLGGGKGELVGAKGHLRELRGADFSASISVDGRKPSSEFSDLVGLELLVCLTGLQRGDGVEWVQRIIKRKRRENDKPILEAFGEGVGKSCSCKRHQERRVVQELHLREDVRLREGVHQERLFV